MVLASRSQKVRRPSAVSAFLWRIFSSFLARSTAAGEAELARGAPQGGGDGGPIFSSASAGELAEDHTREEAMEATGMNDPSYDGRPKVLTPQEMSRLRRL
jgi:hypothetical protein